jgi:hypothetical protein
VTRATWEEERDARILARILHLLEEIMKRLPAPPQYRPTTAIVVVVDPPGPALKPTK